MSIFNEYDTETPLSRVWSTFTESGVAGIISASHQDRSAKENAAATMAMVSKVREAGYGYVFVDGQWGEMSSHGAAVPVRETSVVIRGSTNDNGRLKGLLRNWMNEYDQEGVIFKPEREGGVGVVITNDGTETRVESFHPEDAALWMTKLRGRGTRSFAFESAYTAMGFTGRLLHDRQKESL